jgi:adapter protein MecA 1/2
MEIERINENTVKFYISYMDIEDRGFEREEIWYNRERSEQLFWQMMDEVNYKEDFNVEGPLWIQVQAMEKGLEIIVTKAQVSKDGENIELPSDYEQDEGDQAEKKIENMLEDKFGSSKKKQTKDNEENLWIIVSFKDFEDVIQLSHYFSQSRGTINETLYFHGGKYYLYLEFSQAVLDDHIQENLISQVFEFAEDSDVTIHFLEEYGKVVFENDTFSQIRSYFPARV